MPKRKVEDPAGVEFQDSPPPKKSRKPKVVSMPREALTSSQKAAVNEFTSVTQADKSTAAKVLKQHNWNVGAAANAYFNNPTSGANPYKSSLNKLFDKYRDDPRNSPDEINIEGTSKLLGDLEIDLSDVSAFIFSEIVQSPTLGLITREGFVEGWSDAGTDKLPQMRNVVLQRRSELPNDKELFKNVYNHAFILALQEKQKGLSMEMAMDIWRVLLTAPSFEWRTQSTPWLEWWFEFYEAKVKKAVNKDLWKQTLTFAYETKKDESLSFWSEESSWPSVIDEFVEWVKAEKRPAGGDAMEISREETGD